MVKIIPLNIVRVHSLNCRSMKVIKGEESKRKIRKNTIEENVDNKKALYSLSDSISPSDYED
jgi:hypothetical protein